MQVGDLVTIAGWGSAGQVGPRPVGVIRCFDPEEIGDNEEVAVLWTSVWSDCSYHSSWYLEVISECR